MRRTVPRVAYITSVTGALLALPIGIMAFGDSLSDDSPLAARSRIWDAVFDAVEDRWIVGFGFQSVGDIPVDVGFSTSIGGAHSTFVETLLSLGAIGLILLLAVVVFNVGRVWWQALGGQSWAMGWWAAVVDLRAGGERHREHAQLPLDLLGAAGVARVRRDPILGLDGEHHRSHHGRVSGAVLELHVPVARPKHSTRPMLRSPLLSDVA